MSRLAVLAVLPLVLAVPVAAAELIQPGELQKSYFDGKPFQTKGARGPGATFTFSADGKVSRKSGGTRGTVTEGTWKLSDTGFCMKIGKAKNESCYIAIRDGAAVRVTRVGATAFTWTR